MKEQILGYGRQILNQYKENVLDSYKTLLNIDWDKVEHRAFGPKENDFSLYVAVKEYGWTTEYLKVVIPYLRQKYPQRIFKTKINGQAAEMIKAYRVIEIPFFESYKRLMGITSDTENKQTIVEAGKNGRVGFITINFSVDAKNTSVKVLWEREYRYYISWKDFVSKNSQLSIDLNTQYNYQGNLVVPNVEEDSHNLDKAIVIFRNPINNKIEKRVLGRTPFGFWLMQGRENLIHDEEQRDDEDASPMTMKPIRMKIWNVPYENLQNSSLGVQNGIFYKNQLSRLQDNESEIYRLWEGVDRHYQNTGFYPTRYDIQEQIKQLVQSQYD